MATPRRRSARLSNSRNQRSPVKKTSRSTPQLGSLIERDETPEAGPNPSIDDVLNTPTTQDKVQDQMARLSHLKTPKTEPRPSMEQMHPETAHATTTKAPDSGLKMGFADLPTGRPSSLASLQNTPSKSRPRQSMSNAYAEPNYQFNFGVESQLSLEAQKLMENVREEAARIKAQMLAERSAQEQRDAAAEDTFNGADAKGRKIAKPKGKAGRFSDVHMAQFKKMDSIANHPSSFRAQPSYARPTSQSLKRSPSKAGLDESDRPRTAGKSTPGRPVAHLAGNRASATSIQPSANSSSDRPENPAPAKRARKSEFHDVSAGRELEIVRPSNIPKPVSSSILSPTKASLARAAVASPGRPFEKLSMIPRSNSVKSLRTAYTSSEVERGSEPVRHVSRPAPNPAAVIPPHAEIAVQSMPQHSNIPQSTSSLSKPGGLSSRLPTFSGLRSILRQTRKPPASQNTIERPDTPKRLNTTTTSESAKKVDFTPSVKSRYAVKLAAGSPSPVKLPHLTPGANMSPRGPGVPYDPADFTVDHLMDDDDNENWEDAESEVAYPILPEPEMGPRASAFAGRSKEHNRHESKDFKSIFTDLHQPPNPNPMAPSTQSPLITHAKETSPAHTEPLPKSPSTSSISRPSSSRRSTIRHVRTSEPSNSTSTAPIQPFEDTTIATVPHGLPNKKRRHDSTIFDDKHAQDTDAKENRRISVMPVVPGAFESGTDADVEDEGEKRAVKKARTSRSINAATALKDHEMGASPEKKKINPAREEAKKNAKERKGRGILSLSRLNMLSRPRARG